MYKEVWASAPCADDGASTTRSKRGRFAGRLDVTWVNRDRYVDDNFRAASSDAHCFVRHSLYRGYVSDRRRQPTSRNDVTEVRGYDANEVVVGVWLDQAARFASGRKDATEDAG